MWIVEDIISRSCAKVKHRIAFNIKQRCFGRHNQLIKIKKQLRKTWWTKRRETVSSNTAGGLGSSLQQVFWSHGPLKAQFISFNTLQDLQDRCALQNVECRKPKKANMCFFLTVYSHVYPSFGIQHSTFFVQCSAKYTCQDMYHTTHPTCVFELENILIK